MPRLATFIGIAVVASLLLAACFGDDDEPAPRSPTATSSPSGTSTPGDTAEATGTPISPTRTPTPTATPELVEARITTDRLNVRTGPGLDFPVIGQLFEGDVVRVVGWATDGNNDHARWYGILETGWVIDEEVWLDLDRAAADHILNSPDERLAMVGPRHDRTVRTGTVADRAIEAVISGDADAVAALVRFTERPCSVADDYTAPGCGDRADETLIPAVPISVCHGGHIVDRDELATFVENWMIPSHPERSPEPLRLYGVTEGPFRDWDVRYALLFAFPNGEGRTLWVDEDGAITGIASTCGTLPVGEVLGLPDEAAGSRWLLHPVLPAPLLAATWPAGTRTGDPVVDRVLDALDNGSREALRAVLHPEPLPCIEGLPQMGEPPQCRDDEPSGTLVDTVGIGRCEGGHVRVELALEWFAEVAQVAEEYERNIYAAFHLGRSGWGSNKTFVVFHVLDHEPSERYLGSMWLVLDQEGVIHISHGCLDQPRWAVDGLSGSYRDTATFILPPR